VFLKPYREEDGPFYLIENYLGNCCTQGGIKTDGRCRALNSEHEVIDGLFMAGMDADLESVPYIVGATCHGFSIGSGYSPPKLPRRAQESKLKIAAAASALQRRPG
jgi:hypothetical protein